MTRYYFEVELQTATAQDVYDSLPSMPYQVTGFSGLGKSVILIVDSDDEESIVFEAIASRLPSGTKLHNTTMGSTSVKPSPIGNIAQKLRDKHFPSGGLDHPKNNL